MMLERLILPILGYAGSAAAMAACLYLFVTLKREIAAVAARRLSEREELQARICELRTRIDELEQNLETFAGASAAPERLGRSLNVNKRMQALRMAKRGDGPERISAALGLPAREAQLLIKVQRLISEAAVKTTA
jgi:hypothetical protein